MERSFYLQDHQGSIIGQWGALRKPVHFAEKNIGEISRADFVMFFNQRAQTFSAKKLAFGVGGFCESIGMKYQNVPGLKCDAPLVVADFFKDSEWKAGKLNLAAATFFV